MKTLVTPAEFNCYIDDCVEEFSEVVEEFDETEFRKKEGWDSFNNFPFHLAILPHVWHG